MHILLNSSDFLSLHRMFVFQLVPIVYVNNEVVGHYRGRIVGKTPFDCSSEDAMKID